MFTSLHIHSTQCRSHSQKKVHSIRMEKLSNQSKSRTKLYKMKYSWLVGAWKINKRQERNLTQDIQLIYKRILFLVCFLSLDISRRYVIYTLLLSFFSLIWSKYAVRPLVSSYSIAISNVYMSRCPFISFHSSFAFFLSHWYSLNSNWNNCIRVYFIHPCRLQEHTPIVVRHDTNNIGHTWFCYRYGYWSCSISIKWFKQT